MEKLKLDLPLLLPDMDERDACVRLLTDRLAGVRGVEQAHFVRHNGTAQLCLPFDPNLVPLARLERLAQEAGAGVTQRYRHEQLAFAGLDAADAATTLEDALTRLPGMLHARVSYAAGLLFVAYDRDQLDQTTIERTVKSLGARRPDQARSPSPGPVKQTVMPSMTTAVPLTFCPTGCRNAGH